MKNYVDSKEIAHLWAHQSQESAKCSSAMSFEGPNFYSYSTVIAAIATNPAGDKAYLVSEGQYSATTSRHQGQVRSAIPYSATHFDVPGASRHGGERFNDTTRILKDWAREIEYKLERAAEAKSKKRQKFLLECRAISDKMVAFGEFFQLGVGTVEGYIPRIAVTDEELDRWASEKEQREAAKKAAQEAARKADEALQRKRYAKDRLRWLAGDSVYGWSHYFDPELRIVEGEVETSKGASFPVAHAKRGLALVESVRASKRPWQRNGHTCHLGNYQIDSIDANGTVHAGCHVVSYKAIKRIREQLLTA